MIGGSKSAIASQPYRPARDRLGAQVVGPITRIGTRYFIHGRSLLRSGLTAVTRHALVGPGARGAFRTLMTGSTVNEIATAFQDEGFAPNPDCA